MDEKTIKNIGIDELIPLIEKKWLFNGLWQLKGNSDEGERIYTDLVSRIHEFRYEPKIIYKVMGSNYFSGILELSSQDKREELKFTFNDGIFGKFYKNKNISNKSALLGATAGEGIVKIAKEIRSAGNYHEYFCLYGLSAALAEAATEHGHRAICEALKIPRAESFRISPGYPVWPDISDQKKIDAALTLDKIGVSVSETDLLIPEFSTTAVVLFIE